MLKPEGPETDVMREKILDTAESLIEGSHPQKIKVVSVAQILGVPHTTVYRFFKTKADLRSALSERRLENVAGDLEALVTMEGSASQRIIRWVETLHTLMEALIAGDEELFHTYNGLAERSREVVVNHTKNLINQLHLIIEDGIRLGEFHVTDTRQAAEAVFSGTIRDHHPFFVIRPRADPAAHHAILDMMIAGLKADVV